MVQLTARLFSSTTSKFRRSFIIPDKNMLRWFPGHMNKGMMEMKNKLRSVDCIIEVHDARIPISGRNPNFKHTVSGIKPHILVLNKMDLADLSTQKQVQETVMKEGGISEIIYTNCKASQNVDKILPMAQKLILGANRYHRSDLKEFNLMVIGVPNVGKSTILNTLRNLFLKKGGGAAVGKRAGITRSVTTRVKVCNDPLVYIYDTPGILTPTIPNIETGMKLAVCETTQDHLVGLVTIADYILYWLNKVENFRYVQMFDLDEPCDNIGFVLAKIAVNFRFCSRRKNPEGFMESKPNVDQAADKFVESFRNGSLGKILLDKDILFPTRAEKTEAFLET